MTEKYWNMDMALLVGIIIGLVRVFLGFWVTVSIVFGIPLLIFIIGYANAIYQGRKSSKERE